MAQGRSRVRPSARDAGIALFLQVVLGGAHAQASVAQDLPVVRPGESVEGRIADGDPIVETEALRARPSQSTTVGRSFRLAIDQPGLYRVELTSHFFDAYLIVRQGDGTVLVEDDDGLIRKQACAVFEAQAGQDLRVEACALAGERGPFELALRHGEPVRLEPAARQAAALQDARDAVETVERALGPDDWLLGVRLNELGELLVGRADYQGALPLFERSRAILEKTRGPDHPDTTTPMQNMAWVYKLQGRFEQARPLYEQVLAIREQSLGPDHLYVALTLNNLGSLLMAQGDYAGARPLYERALAIRKKALDPTHPDIANSLNNLAALLMADGDLVAARPLLERALAIREQAFGPMHADVARTLSSLGELLRNLGDYAGARSCHERALAIREKLLAPGHPDLGNSLNNVALVLLSQGEFAEARPLLERSLAIAEKAFGPDHPSVARGLGNLGAALRGLGDPRGALSLCERALDIQQRVVGPESDAVAAMLNNLAELHRDLGDVAQARTLLERSLAIRERLFGPEHLLTAQSLGKVASLMRAQGEHAEARSLSARALAIRERVLGAEHPDVIRELNDLAAADLDEGDAASAMDLLKRAVRGRSSHLARFVQGAGEEELAHYVSTLLWQVELIQSPSLRRERPLLAYESLLAWKGQILRASRASRAALRERLGPEGRPLADRLQVVSAALSRAFVQIGRGEPLEPRQLDSLAQERQRLERDLSPLTAGLVPEVPRWSELRDALPESSALVDVFVHRSYVPARWEGTKRLEAGRWTESEVTAWVTRSDLDEPVAVDLGSASAIEHAAGGAYRELRGARGQPVAPAVDSWAELARQVWEPLREHVQDVDTIILSPDGVLATIPLEILREADGRYLVESRSFVYLTDPTDLVRLGERRPAGDPSVLAVGDVDFDVVEAREGSTRPLALADDSHASGSAWRGAVAGTWTPLAATGREAADVVSVHEASFADGDRQLLSGSAATEERLKAELPRHAVLHLATHAYFNPEGVASLDDAARSEVIGEHRVRDDPPGAAARRLEGCSPGVLSGLVCAGANAALEATRDDGYLTAEEVGWLDLSAVDLVVLSACDTGLGRPRSGEGLIGLRRAFLTAGARTVISSLWSVPDQETADLMGLFYRGLWREKLGTHRALRAAQLEIIQRNRERFGGDARPLTWGAFVLDGDWR